MCVYQGIRNVSFSEDFTLVVNDTQSRRRHSKHSLEKPFFHQQK